MAEIDPVILQLRADLDQYQRELRSTTTLVDVQLGRQEARARRLEAEMKRSSGAIGSTFKGLAATIAAGFGAREVASLADGYTRLQNSLRVAGLEGERLAEVQDRLFEVGSRYGVSVNALADLYGKAEQAGRELGASQSELLSLTEAVSQSILITGSSAYSPDGLVGADGLIECKSRRQKFQIQTIVENYRDGSMPDDFKLQVQTGLLVTGRKWIDLVSFSGGLPMIPIRVEADAEMQEAIIAAATDFEAKVSAAIADYHAAQGAGLRLIPTERAVVEEMYIGEAA